MTEEDKIVEILQAIIHADPDDNIGGIKTDIPMHDGYPRSWIQNAAKHVMGLIEDRWAKRPVRVGDL